MNDTEAVDRVTKAIDESAICDGNEMVVEVVNPRDVARAAIAAYHESLKERNLKILPREPTEEMVANGTSGAWAEVGADALTFEAFRRGWEEAWDAAQGER